MTPSSTSPIPASTDRYLARLDQPIDILVNDAGVNRLAGLVETDDDLLRDTLEMTDGNLTTHMRALQEAGYVSIAKTYRNRRPLTTVSLTSEGRQAFANYIALLEQIVTQTKPR